MDEQDFLINKHKVLPTIEWRVPWERQVVVGRVLSFGLKESWRCNDS